MIKIKFEVNRYITAHILHRSTHFFLLLKEKGKNKLYNEE